MSEQELIERVIAMLAGESDNFDPARVVSLISRHAQEKMLEQIRNDGRLYDIFNDAIKNRAYPNIQAIFATGMKAVVEFVAREHGLTIGEK